MGGKNKNNNIDKTINEVIYHKKTTDKPVEVDLETVVSLYESLIQYVFDLRNMFGIYEERAINKSRHITYQKILKRKRKWIADE